MRRNSVKPFRFGCLKDSILISIILCCALFAFPPAVFAHKVTIFAWVEGDTVYTESKLSGGKRVVDGAIKVYDAKENILVEGRTNDQGEFSFKVPGDAPLVVELNAGMGHMAKWTLQPGDFGEKSSVDEHPGDNTEKQMEQVPTVAPAPSVSAEELKVLIENVMDEKLKPIKRMLIESREDDPSLSEIIGGIGYIIGLMGMAAYFRYRKEAKDRG